MEQFLSELNDAQKAPVLQQDGAMMIIAGAGSGKTRVLTYRIAYLMSLGIDPFNILAITFTNKSANEMKERISKIVGVSPAKSLAMGTFHSVFSKILRLEHQYINYPQNFVIYDQQDSLRLISAIVKEMGLDKDIYKPKDIQWKISYLKNNLITVKAYFNNPALQEEDAVRKRPRFGEIYQHYVERCFRAGAMDFDDLLLKTNELFALFPQVLEKYQNRFKYIMIDEYQDTNHSQYSIVKALADKYQNICVVGDDAQSIYAFRGANISNIFNFQKDFDNVKVFKLEQNYRSTQNIVEAANSVIEKNKNRIEKKVWTSNQKGEKIRLRRNETDNDEARFVANSVLEFHNKESLPYGKFAVLYRNNSQARSIEDALRKYNIPYRIYGGLSFYQHKEIKDVIAYLRLIVNPKDEEALVRVINFPPRGIGDTTLDKLTIAANHYGRSIFEVIQNIDKLNQSLHIQSSIKHRIEEFANMIRAFQIANQTHDALSLAEQVVKKTGLLLEYKKNETPEGIARVQNIEALLGGIRDFVEGQKEVVDARGTLDEFLEDIALITDTDKDIKDENRVSLMTIHASKGLEFPIIYIVGMEENIFPSGMNTETKEGLEEERRLFYVALTRAEKIAHLTYAENRYKFGKVSSSPPSRFISEINPTFINDLTPRLSTPRPYKPLFDADIFGVPNKNLFQQSTKEVEKSKKPTQGNVRLVKAETASPSQKVKVHLKAGDRVQHERFGKGLVISVEGTGQDQKAQINFEGSGIKNILLKFAKLEIL